MAKARGRGIAAVNYPTGMNLGGDPTQALIFCQPTGGFSVKLASTDLGQGLKTVIGQIAAETLGVPLDYITIDTGDTDSAPHCMGTFASRGTHPIQACRACVYFRSTNKPRAVTETHST